ncbi:hypothetical protein NDU88_007606, partial [Pleurodeles waltl]
ATPTHDISSASRCLAPFILSSIVLLGTLILSTIALLGILRGLVSPVAPHTSSAFPGPPKSSTLETSILSSSLGSGTSRSEPPWITNKPLLEPCCGPGAGSCPSGSSCVSCLTIQPGLK